MMYLPRYFIRSENRGPRKGGYFIVGYILLSSFIPVIFHLGRGGGLYAVPKKNRNPQGGTLFGGGYFV